MRRSLPAAAMIAMMLTGCLGGGAASSTHSGTRPRGRIAVAVRLLPGVCGLGGLSKTCRAAAPSVHRYALTCSPAGGTMPGPGRACAAIADYLHAGRPGGGCPGVLTGRGSTATLAGSYAGRPFHLTIAAGYSFCGPPANVVRDLWILSTFPCSNPALHMAGSHFAENIGCGRAAAWRLTTYSGHGITFSYPAPWRYRHRGFYSTMTSPVIDLATQPTQDPCTAHGCWFPVSHLRPGGVVVTWETGAGMVDPAHPPGPGVRVTVLRRGCRVLGGDEELTARVVLRDGRIYEAAACLRGPGVAAHDLEVRAMLASARRARA